LSQFTQKHYNIIAGLLTSEEKPVESLSSSKTQYRKLTIAETYEINARGISVEQFLRERGEMK
jgi:hypothetical protein